MSVTTSSGDATLADAAAFATPPRPAFVLEESALAEAGAMTSVPILAEAVGAESIAIALDVPLVVLAADGLTADVSGLG